MTVGAEAALARERILDRQVALHAGAIERVPQPGGAVGGRDGRWHIGWMDRRLVASALPLADAAQCRQADC